MALDVVEEPGGRFHVWGATPSGHSVLLRIHDFAPYFYCAAPRRMWKQQTQQAQQAQQATVRESATGRAGTSSAGGNVEHGFEWHEPQRQKQQSPQEGRAGTAHAESREEEEQEPGVWTAAQLRFLLSLINRVMPNDSRLQALDVVHRKPIMFYRWLGPRLGGCSSHGWREHHHSAMPDVQARAHALPPTNTGAPFSERLRLSSRPAGPMLLGVRRI
jgi:hypothetical protein